MNGGWPRRGQQAAANHLLRKATGAAIMKLTTLKPRVGTLNTQRAPTLTTEVQRITGSRLQTIRDRILRRANGLCECEICRAPGAVPQIATQIDHIQPLWEGGQEVDSNRQALSAEHHLAKSKAETKRRYGG